MCSSHHSSVAENMMLCPQCDLLVALPDITIGHKAKCPRCKTTLKTVWSDPRKRPIGYALSALFMLLLANLFPFISMQVAGLRSEITLLAIPRVMISDDYVSMATLFVALVQLLPACCMIFIVLLFGRIHLPVSFKVIIAKWLLQLKLWCMVEIFLAGVLVSFVKLMAYGDIGLGLSFFPYCIFCLLQVRAFQCIDRQWLWQHISPAPTLPDNLYSGESGLRQGVRLCACCTAILPIDQRKCPRCQTKGYARRPYSLQWTIALLITSLFLYIPANIMPIMITQALGSTLTSNIMAGVILLWSEGSYPVALVIFIASIMVPSLKILAIAWLCWDAKGHGRSDSERMHFIYEIVEFVGRWSMIDVFVIAVLSALVRMGQIMSITPDIGALLFALTVILTMFSAMVFDPRLTWDRLNNELSK